MTQAKMKSSCKFYAFLIMTIVHRVWELLCDLQDIFLTNRQTPRIVQFNIQVLPFNINLWEKELLKRQYFVFKMGKSETFPVVHSESLQESN